MPKTILTRQKVELAKHLRAQPIPPSFSEIARLLGLKHNESVKRAVQDRIKNTLPDEPDRLGFAKALREFAHRLEHEFPVP